MDTMATRLQAERKKRNWTQRDLARKAGVGPTTIASLESGRSHTSRKLVDIARVLGVNPTWLETGKGPRPALSECEIPYLAAASPEHLAQLLAEKSDEELIELFRLFLTFRR